MSESEALKIARAEAQRHGWPWEEPIAAMARRRFLVFGAKRWEILSNARARGRNVSVWIDDETGRVLASGYNER